VSKQLRIFDNKAKKSGECGDVTSNSSWVAQFPLQHSFLWV